MLVFPPPSVRWLVVCHPKSLYEGDRNTPPSLSSIFITICLKKNPHNSRQEVVAVVVSTKKNHSIDSHPKVCVLSRTNAGHYVKQLDSFRYIFFFQRQKKQKGKWIRETRGADPKVSEEKERRKTTTGRDTYANTLRFVSL